MRRIILTVLLIGMLISPATAFAQSNICEGTTCSREKVGAFMAGISAKCGNVGDCSLNDIMTVVSNVGNFILGIIGSLVFLMYIIGGMYFLAAGGNPERVEKGKKYFKISTIGLIIVFVAYAGLFSLSKALGVRDIGPVEEIGEEGFVAGASCGDNKIYDEAGNCLNKCAFKMDTAPEGEIWACENKNTTRAPETCETGLCPGAANIQCCRIQEA